MPKNRSMSAYNGPSRERFLDSLADYEEIRYEIMALTAKSGKVLSAWEKAGGDKADLRDGFALRQMTPEQQRAELRRQYRVASYMDIVSVEADGQTSFEKLFDAPPVQAELPVGIGGAPAGSRLAIVRAKTTGFREGRAKGGPTMQEGIQHYGWEADSEEALSYAEGFGAGLELRPPPKASKDDIDPDEGDEDAGISVKPPANDSAPTESTAPRRRGRPPGSGKKAAAGNVTPITEQTSEVSGAVLTDAAVASWMGTPAIDEEIPGQLH